MFKLNFMHIQQKFNVLSILFNMTYSFFFKKKIFKQGTNYGIYVVYTKPVNFICNIFYLYLLMKLNWLNLIIYVLKYHTAELKWFIKHSKYYIISLVGTHSLYKVF